MNSQHCSEDVVVLGGGPAGCATALALQAAGINKIAIVEASHYENTRIGESLPPDTRQLLERLGLLTDFLQEDHEVCLGSCASWGSDALGYNDFLFNPHGNGWHLDRNRFDSFLAKKAVERGITFHSGWRFQDCEPTESGFDLILQQEHEEQKNNRAAVKQQVEREDIRTVEARYVVDATGRGSYFARKQGAKRLLLDNLICAIYFFDLPSESDFPQLTILEAVEYGWWYAARISDSRLIIAVASESKLVKELGLDQSAHWMTYLRETQHIATQLDEYSFFSKPSITDPPLVCAAPSFVLDQVGGARWLAVGDAASAYDPISSQGIYKALSDGLAAAQVVTAHFQGESPLLGSYQQFVGDRFDDYLRNRNYFYNLEQRWPSSIFWNQRCSRKQI